MSLLRPRKLAAEVLDLASQKVQNLSFAKTGDLHRCEIGTAVLYD